MLEQPLKNIQTHCVILLFDWSFKIVNLRNEEIIGLILQTVEYN